MNAEEILSLKDEADRIMSISGNTRGSSLTSDAQSILNKEGSDSIERLEGALELLGYPISYGNIKSFDWYKEAQSVLGIYVASKIFGWSEKDLFDLGYTAPTTSMLVKLVLRFVSLEKTFRQASTLWEKHYDFGSFEALEFNGSEKYLTCSLRDYPFLEWMKDYFDGFFMRMMQLVGINDIEKFEGEWCSPGDFTCRLYEVRWR